MAWGALAGALAAGRTKFRSTTPRGKGRRPRPISSGPKTGRRPGGKRRLTTSEAAIRRFEQQKRGGTRGRPARPARPTGTGRGPQRTSRTSRTAIARSRARIARRR